MSDPHFTFTADMANGLESAYSTQLEARQVFGARRQDLKIIEEATELVQALSRRLGHYELGGKRGDVDGELADALFTILGAMPPDSPAWDILRAKTAKLRGIIEGARVQKPAVCLHVAGEVENG